MPSKPPGPSRERAGIDALAWGLVVAGAVLRFLLLGQQSFWHDEIHSVLNAGGSESPTLSDTVANTHGPLYLMLLRGWIALVGHGEGPVRALSALFGVLGLLVFHRVLARFTDRAATRTGLALLAFSPFHLGYSQEARNYALLFALGMFALLALLGELERRTPRTFALALLSIAATCLTNLSGYFLIVIAGVVAWTHGRPRGYPMRRFVLMALLLGVLLAPWIRGGLGTTGKISVGAPPPRSDVILAKGESPPGLLSIPYSFYDFVLGRSLGPSVDDLKQRRLAALVPHLPYLLPIAALMTTLLLLGMVAAGPQGRAVLLPWLLVPLLLVAILSGLNLKAANSRYAFLAFGPLLAFLALGLSTLRSSVWRAGALGAVLLVFAVSDVRHFADGDTWRPDARGVGRLLAREVRPNDAVVVYALDYPVRYYTPAHVPLLTPPTRVFASDSSVAAWLVANAGDRRLWLVQCESWWMDRGDRMRQACDRDRTRERAWSFLQMPVYRYAARGTP